MKRVDQGYEANAKAVGVVSETFTFEETQSMQRAVWDQFGCVAFSAPNGNMVAVLCNLAALEAELKERDLQLRHLLCIIHRDGGHHTQAHGLEQSIEDAKEKFFDLRDLPDTVAQQAERIEELSFDAAMANQAREIGNHFGLTYMQVWSDTSIASQVIDKMKEQQTTIAQQAEQLAAAERDAERYRWLRSNHPIHDNSPFICRNFGAAFSQWTDDQADKAIDAAIAASREGKS